MQAAVDPTPGLRGVFHVWGFLFSVPAGLLLLAGAEAASFGPLVVYVISLTGLLAASSAYHRLDWGPRARRWMRRLDHSMIFALIGGTYTPIAILGIGTPGALSALQAVWVMVALGVLMKLAWIDAPDWVAVVVYMATGAVAFAMVPEVYASVGFAGAGLFVVGGIVFAGGGVVFASEFPNPRPEVFGYHEIFHVCTIIGIALHYAAIAVYVV